MPATGGWRKFWLNQVLFQRSGGFRLKLTGGATMNDIISLLFIAVICAAIGFALGMLISSLRSSKEQPKEVVPAKNSHPFISFQLPRIGAGWRLEMDGKAFSTPGELDATQRNHLMQGITELRNWVVVDQNTSVDTAQTMPSAADSSPVRPPVPAVAEAEKNRVNLNPINVFARAIQADVSKVDQPNKSIAAQIDEILQEKLVNTPLSQRAIRLMELPGKGMVVMVGLDQYDGVSSVPDPEIRELIRSCVAEWERRVV
jgi:hypothetical protein